MNIALISTFDNVGGAPIAAFRLHKGFRELNLESAMIVRFKKSDDPHVYPIVVKKPEMNIETEVFKLMEKRAVQENRTDLSNTVVSLPYPGYDLSETALIREADIINLHWMAYFQSVESIAALLKLGKPVVWTLHDQNAFTGGCHYTAGCEKYREDCRDCPQLKDNTYQVPFHVLKNKLTYWKNNLTVVTPSRWLAQCARESKLFKGSRVEVIPNSLETGIFKPKAKEEAKKGLGLDPRLITLLFGAHSGNEKRKGFRQLLDAMRFCLKDRQFRKLAKEGGIKIFTFGPPQEDLEKLDIAIQSFGYIENSDKLAVVYSAADIFVMPSLEDNLPNTMLEAMACGTPVVSFDVGGMPDMIRNGITGYLAPCFDSEKLGESILKLIFETGAREQMNRNCRDLIEKKFKLRDQARNYLDLFNDLLKNKESVPINKNTEKSIMKQGEILLDDPGPVRLEGLVDIYRQSVLELLIEWMGQKRKLHQQLNQIKHKLRQFAPKNHGGSGKHSPFSNVKTYFRKVLKKIDPFRRLPGPDAAVRREDQKNV